MEEVHRLQRHGYAILRGVYSPEECRACVENLSATLEVSHSPTVHRRGDVIYGARDLLRLFPQTGTLWRREPLVAFLGAILGECGLVRGLFFDKPRGAGWALPWHRDLTIAVRDNSLSSDQWPTLKAGVPHVEAPTWLLQRMLTLRIHLDDMTDDNGPLRVLPGSHVSHDMSDATTCADKACAIHVSAGDVLAMRPLLLHASSGINDEKKNRDDSVGKGDACGHRRVVHLEFAANVELPDGYEWRDYFSVADDQRILR